MTHCIKKWTIKEFKTALFTGRFLVEYQVHWPLITGRPIWLGSQGSCKVYQSLFTDPP